MNLRWKGSVVMRFALLSFCIFPGLEPVYAQEATFPMPATTGVFGKKDPSALTVITAYLQASATSGWHDLQASGTLTYPSGDSHSAEFFLSESGYSRLDITMNSGTRSVRLSGPTGAFQDEKGNRGSLLPTTSAAGIVALPRVWIDAATSPNVSLFDRGIFTDAGQPLRRITMEYQIVLGRNQSNSQSVSLDIATDLYFDPTSNLLAASADAVTFNEARNHPFTRITRYSNYHPMSGILIPDTISQTIDGQLQWTLQLDQITVNSNPPQSTFQF
jgi:hypothetical protein